MVRVHSTVFALSIHSVKYSVRATVRCLDWQNSCISITLVFFTFYSI